MSTMELSKLDYLVRENKFEDIAYSCLKYNNVHVLRYFVKKAPKQADKRLYSYLNIDSSKLNNAAQWGFSSDFFLTFFDKEGGNTAIVYDDDLNDYSNAWYLEGNYLSTYRFNLEPPQYRTKNKVNNF